MEKEAYSIDELKKAIMPIARKYEVSKVYLFGSYARGENRDDSDIDLRIDKGRLKGLFALAGFYTEVKETLNKEVDVLTTGSLDEDFLNEIKKEEILLYEE